LSIKAYWSKVSILDLSNMAPRRIDSFQRSESRASGSYALCTAKRSRIVGCERLSVQDRSRAATLSADRECLDFNSYFY
jgi:hypothetical protein